MSRTTFRIFEPYRDVLARAGLDSFDALFAFDGGRHVDGHRDRNVVRLELPGDDGRPVAFYLKREWHPKAAMLIRRMLTGWLRPPPSRSARECRNLEALGRRGIATAEPAAVGEVRDGAFYKRALLLVREVPGAVSLGAYLRDVPAEPSADDLAARRAVIREVADLVRRMHDAGMAYRDLFAKHIFVAPPRAGESARPTLIDAQRAYRFPHLVPHARWRDLAALAVTTLHTPCTRTDRLRFLLAYARQSRLTPAVKLMVSRIGPRADKLRGKGTDPRLSNGMMHAPPGMTPLGEERFRHVDRRRIFVNEWFLPELRRLGLDTFDAVMACAAGEPYRDAPDRLTVRIPITGADGRPSAIYLKRHQRVDRGAWVEGLLKWRKARTRADVECRNIFLLAEFDIPTVRPVALGQRQTWSPRQQSFLMTEEIPGGVPADDYLKAHFAAASPPAPTSDDKARAGDKHRLVRRIARLARRLHRAGFYHRDLYLCHVFVRELPGAEDEHGHARRRGSGTASSAAVAPVRDEHGHASVAMPPDMPPAAPPARLEWVLHLIDLQRVRWPGPGKVRRRWIVKDLAELNYSAPAEAISRTDKLRFLRAYLALGSARQAGRLPDRARKLAGDVVAKTRRIARHDARRQSRRT